MSRRGLETIRDIVLFVVVAYSAFAAAAAFGSIEQLERFLAFEALLVALLLAIVLRWRLGQSQAEAELDASEKRYQDIFEGAGDMVFTLDLHGRIVSLNTAGERLLEYTRDEAVGMSLVAMLAHQHQEWPAEIFAKHLRVQSAISSDLVFVSKGGNHTPVEVSSQVVHRDGKPVAIQCIARDTTQRRRAEQQLTHFANHDPLTNLYNRRRFEEELEHQLTRARREHSESALLFLDLDHFKDVNDSEGHGAGDQLLQTVGRMLRDGMRDVDVVARLGGDEFTMLLVNATVAEAEMTAAKILSSLEHGNYELGNRLFKITGSIGIAMLPTHGNSAAELLSAADLAMYRAKDRGRNSYAVLPEQVDLQSEVSARVSWHSRISKALEEDQFRLHAQPILDLRKNEVTQHELLLRIDDPNEEGVVVAAEFIESAERFGLIQAIDRWAVARAIKLLKECARWNLDISLEVNISGKAFGDAELLDTLHSAFAGTSLHARRLILEVTETAAIENMQQAQDFVSELKEIGCRFALDDFGAGFSSFHQLRSLDVDYLKIDGSFIQNLPKDTVGQHLVRAIVEMARALNKETIAEYVTDDATLTLVRGLGVDYAQGHAVGFPRDADEAVIGDAILPPPPAIVSDHSSRKTGEAA